jgi:hypothetical protein
MCVGKVGVKLQGALEKDKGRLVVLLQRETIAGYAMGLRRVKVPIHGLLCQIREINLFLKLPIHR